MLVQICSSGYYLSVIISKLKLKVHFEAISVLKFVQNLMYHYKECQNTIQSTDLQSKHAVSRHTF